MCRLSASNSICARTRIDQINSTIGIWLVCFKFGYRTFHVWPKSITPSFDFGFYYIFPFFTNRIKMKTTRKIDSCSTQAVVIQMYSILLFHFFSSERNVRPHKIQIQANTTNIKSKKLSIKKCYFWLRIEKKRLFTYQFPNATMVYVLMWLVTLH